MNNRIAKIFLLILFMLIPFLMIGLGFVYFSNDKEFIESTFKGFTDFAVMMGIITACLSILFVLGYTIMTRQMDDVQEEMALFRSINDEVKTNNQTLQNEVDLLVAMRDINRVAADPLQFEQSLANILTLTGKQTGAKEILLFVSEDSAEPSIELRLTLKARWDGRECRLADDIHVDLDELDDSNVFEAYGEIKSFTDSNEKFFSIATPLVVDGEPVGVVKLVYDMPENPAALAQAIERAKYRAESIVKHISLPLKNSHLYDQAILDSMTKLYTKRNFLNRMDIAFGVACARSKPLAVLIMDIDKFKTVNEQFGYEEGDHVLTGVARQVRDSLRASDAAYRYGSAKIAVILLGVTHEKAMELAERIRANVEGAGFKTAGGKEIKISASVGVAEYNPEIDNPQQLLDMAEEALSAAKAQGRNRVVLWSPQMQKS